jgi:hypothetical protein
MQTVGTIRKSLLKLRPVKQIVSLYFHRQTDCYVISYPKSGRTWLRTMLAKVLALHFGDTRKIVVDPMDVMRKGRHRGPLIRFIHDGSDRSLRRQTRRPEKQFNRFMRKKVIFLVRDPRDVLVSSYFQLTRRGDKKHKISEFVRDPWWGIDRVVAFMSEWYEHRKIPSGFLLVRYEDLHEEPLTALHRIIEFIGLDNVADEVVKRSVDYASFENMRKMSLNELKNVARLAPKDPQDPESFKVRRGEVGGYMRYLSPDDVVYIEKRIGRSLHSSFGYSNSSIG